MVFDYLGMFVCIMFGILHAEINDALFSSFHELSS